MQTKEEKELKDKSYKSLLWLGIVSIIMLFAALTSCYIVVQADNFWVKFNLPRIFYLSCAIILLSSATINWAMSSAKKNDTNKTKNALLITLFLGFAFCGTQYYAWSEMVKEGKVFRGDISDLKGEYGKDYVIMFKGKDLVSIDGKFYSEADH